MLLSTEVAMFLSHRSEDSCISVSPIRAAPAALPAVSLILFAVSWR
jgi:hypothetical protein